MLLLPDHLHLSCLRRRYPKMATLAQLLPAGIRGYETSRALGRQEESHELGQLATLLQLRGGMMQQEEAQRTIGEKRQLSEMLSQHPDIASNPVLLGVARNRPEALLPYMMERQKDLVVPPGSTVLRHGQPSFTAPDRTKAPTTRTVFEGNTSIQQELQSDGTWKKVGSGPRFSTENDSPYTNIKEDPLHPGKFVGMNRKTGRMESVPDTFTRPTINMDLKGEEFLTSLDPQIATQVKAISEGRQPIPSGFAMRSPYWQNMMSMVSQYDPSYNSSRQQVWKDFTSGLSARNITAMNTAIAHMGTMDKLADALKNNDIQAQNALTNFVRNQLGKPEIINYNLATQAVSDELMRVFRQVNASQQEAEEFRQKFSNAVAARSPDQMKGALKVASELLRGRLDAVNDQWKRGMNKESDFPNIISPQSRETLRSLGVTLGGADKPVEFRGYTFPNQGALDKYKKAAGINE